MADEALGQPSMDELEEWIGKVEDKVWVAERDAAVSRFVLGNLVLELGRSGVIDAHRFIQKLQVAAPLHPDYPEVVQDFLAELQRCLPDDGPDGEPGESRVFH